MRRGREALKRAASDSRWRAAVVSGLAVLAAALSMQPLLDRAWWLPATALAVATVVAAGCLSRALHLVSPMQPVVQAIALTLVTTLLFAREQAVWGVLPGPTALGHLRDLAAQGRAYAQDTVPPAGPDQGLLLLILAGVGLIALAVDTLAVAVDLPGLTLVPLAALFGVPWAIAGSASGWAFTVVALAWLAILSTTQQDRASRWSPRARAGSPASGALIGAAAISMALAAGALVQPDGGPFRVGSGAGAGGSVEVQALVSLRRSLISNDERVLLSYSTSAPVGDYLRLAVLERFDGTQWRAAPGVAASRPPSGPAGGAVGTGSGPLADYRLDVGPLAGGTIPSPAGTVAVLNDWPIAWDQRTGLPARADGRTIEGSQISLVAAPAELEAADLRLASRQPTAAGAQPPAETTADPEPIIGARLPGLAQQITQGTGTPFDAAVALQEWFTVDGGFAYSTQVAGGADEAALDDFLDERVGYCEQFSATMALMARSLGIPARLVVGFTQGRREGDSWVVRGTDAHAWPELWMGTAGWVRFEPTPGAPTTVSPEYARPSPDEAPSEAPAEESAPTDAPTQGQEPLPLDDPGTAGQLGDDPARIPVLPIAVFALMILMAIPALIRTSRRWQRMSRGDPESAYREVVDTMIDLRLGEEAATPRSTLAATAALLPGAHGTPDGDPDSPSGSLDRILAAVERSRYAPPGPAAPGRDGRAVALAEPEAPRAAVPAADVRALRQALGRRAGPRRRTLALVWPRSAIAAAVRRVRPRAPRVDEPRN